jgi:hypothetical protein
MNYIKYSKNLRIITTFLKKKNTKEYTKKKIKYLNMHIYTDNIYAYLNKLWKSNINENNLILLNYILCKLKILFDTIYNIFFNIFINKLSINKLKNDIPILKKLGFTFYNSHNDPQISNISNNELNKIINFQNSSIPNKINIIKNLKNYVYKKYKYGNNDNNYNPNKPENYRYMINHNNSIKILDRIWYNEIISKCSYLPNSNIFKLQLKYTDSDNIINIANNNTLSLNNVILLDIIRAYDSVEWNIVEKLLFSNLKKKMNIFYAYEYVNQYMLILKNRNIYYNNNKLLVSKGISTGLPSSCIIFTFIIEEIIDEWLYKNKNIFEINIDFNINIYVDDFYIKIYNISKTHIILFSLIEILKKYKLYINFNKSKIDKHLYNCSQLTQKLKILHEYNLYLGIPFTRNIELYKNIILSLFHNKYNLYYNWNRIYNILTLNEINQNLNKIRGFMYYKLKPLLLLYDNLNNNNLNDRIIYLIKNYIL